MRKIMRWGTVPLLVLFAASCTDENPITGPESGTTTTFVSTSDVDVADGETTTDTLLAAQDIPVGVVNVTHHGGDSVTVNYEMFAGFCLDETHWEANYVIGNLTNNGGQPAPGQFEFGDDDLDCVTTYTETADVLGSEDDEPGYVVAAHAVVEGTGTADNPNVVFGIVDEAGDGGVGSEEGDIYGINPTTGDLTLVADIPNDPNGDPFAPNGLALDRATETLFFVNEDAADGQDLFSIPATGGAISPVRQDITSAVVGGEGTVRNATVAGDFYYFVPNDTDELWRVALDGSSAPALHCDLDFGSGLLFGDIGANLAETVIYGVAQGGGAIRFFTASIADCGTDGATFKVPTSYDFLVQVAFGDDGTLYAERAVSAGGIGEWYILESDLASADLGEITSTLSVTARSFTDIAGGLPGEPVEFDETAWADGDRFTQRGNWAMYMGPFTLVE